MRQALALAFLVWCAFITVAAGFLGSALNCEDATCQEGSPSWLEPWAWGDYYVHPNALIMGCIGLAAATVFVALVFARRRAAAAFALPVVVVFLSYAFFAGLTASGKLLFWPGILLGVAALLGTGARSAVEA